MEIGENENIKAGKRKRPIQFRRLNCYKRPASFTGKSLQDISAKKQHGERKEPSDAKSFSLTDAAAVQQAERLLFPLSMLFFRYVFPDAVISRPA